MKTEKIFYKRNFLLNPMTMEHQHLGVEMILEEGDTIGDVLDKAKETIESWVMASGIAEEARIKWAEAKDEPFMMKEEMDIKLQVMSAQSIEELGKLRPGLPVSLMKPYMDKLKELTAKIV